jgi:hypothetical protein
MVRQFVTVRRRAGGIIRGSLSRQRRGGSTNRQDAFVSFTAPVTQKKVSAPALVGHAQATGTESPRRLEGWKARYAWPAVALGVIGVAALFVVLTGMRPAYDAYGWLVWGRQAVHLHLDTSAAPSWKPLTFLFTFPYALLSPRGALWLWMVTAVAGALAGAVFAARIAYKLTGGARQRRYAPIVASAFAGLGVLGIADYWQLILSATADAMVVSLCLGAVDRHLSGHPRQAWMLLVLASLGRPEAWPLAGLYGLWASRANPSMRAPVVVGLALIPALWFGIPAVTSGNWFIAGDVARGSWGTARAGPIARVASGYISLHELPMQLAALIALLIAIFRRERTWLLLAAAAFFWLFVEAALALHGWSGNRRFVFAPAAVMVVLAGAGLGRLLALAPGRPRLVYLAAPAAVIALVAALAPEARVRARQAHTSIVLVRSWARQINRLHAVIAGEGGPRRILACGQPVTEVSYQSILAWEMGVNVVDVGWDPAAWIRSGQAIVLFEPHDAGWRVRPVHIPAGNRPGCDRLRKQAAVS